MLNVYVSGIPINAKVLLNDALLESMGEGVVSVEELGKDLLKTKVRLSLRNPSIILVVLDSVSTDICKDIENGLYSSDKFFSYNNISDFVIFLNNKFGVNLEVPQDEEEEGVLLDSDRVDVPVVDQAIIDNYEKQISHKDFLIRNLSVRVKDLEQQLDQGAQEGVSETSEEVESSLRVEILDLKNKLLTIGSVKEDLVKNLKALEEERDKVSESNTTLSANYNAVVSELSNLRSKYTLQSTVIDSKDKKIESMQSKIESLEEEIESKGYENSSLSQSLSEKSMEVERLKVDSDSKDKELFRCLKELSFLKENQIPTERLEKAEETITSLQSDVKAISRENSDLKKNLSEVEIEKGNLLLKISSLEEAIVTRDSKIETLEKRAEEDNDSIAELNKKCIDLQSRVSLNDRVSNQDDFSEEYVRLRKELAEVKEGVFGRISSLSLPSSALRVNLIPAWEKGFTLKNVRFVFAGSTESRKGSYKCILNELRSANPKVNYLIVDLVSETSIDYVFEITKIVPGLDWFRKGGSVLPYVSKTVLKNVGVLSSGLRYINDAYFLCVDWVRRLKELEESGYQVMVFCGDLSNLVGRILHESFAGLGISVIYIHGNAVGARSLVTNLRGITNSDKSIVGYFDYSDNVKRFYDVISASNKCKIISRVKR